MPLSPQGYNIGMDPTNTNPFWDNEPVPEDRGLPAGGNPGQVLTKKSEANYDAEWRDPTGGGGSGDGRYYINVSRPASEGNAQCPLSGFKQAGDQYFYSSFDYSNLSGLDTTKRYILQLEVGNVRYPCYYQYSAVYSGHTTDQFNSSGLCYYVYNRIQYPILLNSNVELAEESVSSLLLSYVLYLSMSAEVFNLLKEAGLTSITVKWVLYETFDPDNPTRALSLSHADNSGSLLDTIIKL